MTNSKFIKKTALSTWVLMNPILFLIVIWVDSPNSNEWLHGKPLLERTPFAYSYFWSSAFLPGDPPNFELAMVTAIISNTILYSVLSYIVLNGLWKDSIKLS